VGYKNALEQLGKPRAKFEHLIRFT
jgi:hypothetical protein